MKKVLALVVAFALCFTVFAGCFATSAAAVADSFKVVGSTVEAAGGAATVTVSGAYDAKTVQLLTVTLPADVTFVSVNGMTQLTADGTEGDYVVNGQVIKFLTIADSTFEIVINVTVPANETAEDVTYDVAAVVEFAAWNDTAVSNDTANGNITVKAKVVEPQGPVLDENIEVAQNTVAIGETFGISLRYKLSTLKAEYASYKLKIKRTTTNGDFNFTYVYDTIETFNKSTTQDLLIPATYYGIQLFSLTAPIEYTLHCYNTDGEEVAYSKTVTTTLAEIAVSYHNLDSTSAAYKKVMADLIQVGAAALQHYTNGKDVDYATLPVPTIDSPYITTELGELASYNSTEGLAVTITGAVQQSMYYNMRFAGNVADKAEYRFDVTFYNAMTKKNDIYTVAGSTMNGNATTIAAKLETFPVFATNADVTFTLYRNDEVIATNHYCLDTYIADTIAKSSSATLKVLLQELGELAQSFRTARKI